MKLLEALNPYAAMIKGAVVIGLAVAFFVAAHNFLDGVEDRGYQRAVAEAKERERLASVFAQKWSGELTRQRDEAIQNGNQREQTIRDLAAAAGNASVGLRDTLNTIRRNASNDSTETLRHTTVALATVLDDCQVKYRELAEKADRHANDVRTYSEAWPVAAPSK